MRQEAEKKLIQLEQQLEERKAEWEELNNQQLHEAEAARTQLEAQARSDRAVKARAHRNALQQQLATEARDKAERHQRQAEEVARQKAGMQQRNAEKEAREEAQRQQRNAEKEAHEQAVSRLALVPRTRQFRSNRPQTQRAVQQGVAEMGLATRRAERLVERKIAAKAKRLAEEAARQEATKQQSKAEKEARGQAEKQQRKAEEFARVEVGMQPMTDEIEARDQPGGQQRMKWADKSGFNLTDTRLIENCLDGQQEPCLDGQQGPASCAQMTEEGKTTLRERRQQKRDRAQSWQRKAEKEVAVKALTAGEQPVPTGVAEAGAYGAGELKDWLRNAHSKLSVLQMDAVTASRGTPAEKAQHSELQQQISKLNLEIDAKSRCLKELLKGPRAVVSGMADDDADARAAEFPAVLRTQQVFNETETPTAADAAEASSSSAARLDEVEATQEVTRLGANEDNVPAIAPLAFAIAIQTSEGALPTEAVGKDAPTEAMDGDYSEMFSQLDEAFEDESSKSETDESIDSDVDDMLLQIDAGTWEGAKLGS